MLTEKAIIGLMKAPAEKRYKSFLNTVTDIEEVWFLCSTNGYATFDAEGFVHVLIWPRKEFAQHFISDGENAVSMEIHEFLEKCKSLDDSVRFMVFPTDLDSYVVTTHQLCHDIQEYLEELE